MLESINVRATKRTILPIFVAFLALFAFGIDSYIQLAILPQLSSEFGLPAQVIGLLNSAYALPLALLAPLFGPLSGRVGYRKAMLLGMVIFIIAEGVNFLAPSYEFLLVARFVNGVAAALFIPAAYAYIANRASAETRAREMSTILTALPLSALVGLPLGGFIARVAGWRSIFGFIEILALISLLFLWSLPSERSSLNGPGGYREGIRIAAGNRKLLKVITITFLWTAASFGSLTYISQFFLQKYNFSSDQTGLVLMVLGIVGILATQIGARFIHHLGNRRSVLFGIAAVGAAILILPWTSSVPVSILIFGIWAFGFWFGFPAQQTIVSELTPGARAIGLSFNTAAQYLGAAVGPVVSGVMLRVGSFPMLGVWGTFLAVCAFLVALRILPGRVAAAV